MSTFTTLGSLIFLQLSSRLLTFALNQSLFRLASPSAYGTAAIQFELLSSTVLFLSREGVRNTLLRAGSSPVKSNDLHALAFVPFIIGVPISALTSFAYLYFAPKEATAQPNFFPATSLYVVAALIELLSEPGHNFVMNQNKTSIRVRAEGLGFTLKTLVTFLVLLWDTRQNANEAGQYALIAFGLGQLAYACVVLGVYIVGLYPFGTSSTVDNDQLKLAMTMTGQSVVKHFLTEGDKLILSFFSPLEDQGGYAIAVNYGSLIARIVFQPIEETLRLYFSRTLQSRSSDNEEAASGLKRSSSTLEKVLHGQISVSIPFMILGSSYLPLALKVMLPGRYLKTSAPTVLGAWIYYIPVLAINGGLEAFVSSTASPADLNRQSWYMALFSILYSCSAVTFYTAQIGDASLVYANIVNLSARIIYALSFVRTYFESRNQRFRMREAISPGRTVVITAVASWSILKAIHVDETRHLLDREVLAYIGLGGFVGVVFLGVLWVTEKENLGLRELGSLRRSKSTKKE